MTDGRIAPAANAFGPAARDYERARPAYPPAAIDVLVREVGLGPGTRVCDLAAGTGKLTRSLAGTGADVVAVEPVAGMREQLASVVADVEVLDGVAEAIPLPDASIDVVTVAQAFHWFRPEDAMREIRRVLRPGGRVAILFNERDGSTAWVDAWNREIEWHAQRIATYKSTDWPELFGRAGFTASGEAHVSWAQPMTRELLAARMRSVSYVAQLPPADQNELVARVVQLVDGLPEPFDLPYVTHVWWAKRP